MRPPHVTGNRKIKSIFMLLWHVPVQLWTRSTQEGEQNEQRNHIWKHHIAYSTHTHTTGMFGTGTIWMELKKYAYWHMPNEPKNRFLLFKATYDCFAHFRHSPFPKRREKNNFRCQLPRCGVRELLCECKFLASLAFQPLKMKWRATHPVH